MITNSAHSKPTPATPNPAEGLLGELAAAVQDEIAAAKKDEKWVNLADGQRVGAGPGGFAYRFEIPDGVSSQALQNVEECTITVQNVTVPGEITSVDSQFITIKVDRDLGAKVPSLRIKWSTTLVLRKMLERLEEMREKPEKFSLAMVSTVFSPTKTGAVGTSPATALDDGQRNPNQLAAIRGAMSNTVSFVWGPPGTGKTTTLGYIACSLVEAGERVLLVSNTNRAVDVALQQVIKSFKHVGREWRTRITRYGRPFITGDEDLDRIYFGNQVEAVRARMLERIAKQAALLKTFDALVASLAEVQKLKGAEAATRTRLDEAKAALERFAREIATVDERLRKAATGDKLVQEYRAVRPRLRAFTATLQELNATREDVHRLTAALQSSEAQLATTAGQLERRQKGGLLSIFGSFRGPSLDELKSAHAAASAAVTKDRNLVNTMTARLRAIEQKIEQHPDKQSLSRFTALDASLRALSTELGAGSFLDDGYSLPRLTATLKERAADLEQKSAAIAARREEDAKKLGELVEALSKHGGPALEARMEAAKTELDALGGVDAVRKLVAEHSEVDEGKLLKEMRLVGSTLAKAVANKVLSGDRFDAVLIDEASMVSLPYLAVLAGICSKRVIVVGDPKQLPPIALGSTKLTQRWMERDLFLHASRVERVDELFAWHDANPEFTFFLDTQYRMTGELSGIINELFYAGRLKHGRSDEPADELAGILLIDTGPLHPGVVELKGAHGKFPVYNPTHTEKVIEALRGLAQSEDFDPGTVGVVMPLNSAVQWTRQQLRTAGFRTVEVGTVHTFQGREKEIIIFDTVVAGVDFTIRLFDENKTGDLPMRLLNVALSRTKKTLVVVADMPHFRSAYRGKLVATVLARIEKASIEVSGAEEIDVPVPVVKVQPAGPEPQPVVPPPVTQSSGTLPPEVERDGPKEVAASDPPVTVAAPPTDAQEDAVVGTPSTPPVVAGSKAECGKEVRKLGQQIVSLRSEVNTLALKLRGNPLFMPSVEGERVAGMLPTTAVTSETEFKDWIDAMYKYLYEASGGGNAREPLLARNTPAPDIRWFISKLRNGFFHDSSLSGDAVGEREVQRKVYNDLLGKAYPTQPREWSQLQLAVMFRVTEWLANVVKTLRA